MTDHDILVWIQENLTQFSQTLNQQFVVGYIDKDGLTKYQYGDSLKDCVMKASAKCSK